MPDNPHNSAEEKLREYAQLRKGELDDDIKLSDTHRRRLLQEVDEVYNKSEKSAWILVYRSIWGKIALACCGLLIFGIFLKNVLEKPDISMARTDVISEKQSLSIESKTRNAENGFLLNSSPQPSKPVDLAESLPEQPYGSVKSVKAESANIAANVKMETPSSGSNYKTLQNEDRLYSGLPKEKIVSAGRTESAFSSATAGVGLATTARVSPPNYADLFSRFKIEVKDSKVVVTGEDGSTYEGEFIGNSKLENSEILQKIILVEKDYQSAFKESAATLLFNVKGTNNTLNKSIEFIGRFIVGVQPAETPIVAKRGLALNERRLGLSAKTSGVDSSSERINNEQYYSKTADTVKTQTNIVILFLNGSTNTTIRAILNQDGFYQRVTN